MTTIYQSATETAGAAIASDVRRELLSRKRVGKCGLPLHIVREDQIKTRWTESEAATIKSTANALDSNPAVETNVAAIRGFLAMFNESPQMLAYVHRELLAAGLPVPNWLPVSPIQPEVPL
ncbi:hypothetical protein AXW37_06295 [Yersinia ruckeri]|uniref:hypothetical protein n=1 Tax=Yersinia ruckeri TaxID=29486 RepID=UPI0008FD0B2C|nr:hypothetical protein [Yersinia ruckeri]MCK8585279.1 hypothetical protein [Yersinia ruckeri]MCW6524266.1 hypothetical protein [Yersinia ruckeri]MCW6604759.1 hypothetical protein [Yersinia ruckeri]MDN0091737.1 hypothetical protein [Yersinia ruckeri]OIX46793.1 hypothetical protein AXW22_06060 [Yersinia ruckeri]